MTTDSADSTSSESVGSFFKQRRLMAGLTIEQVAFDLRIKPGFIRAIEEGNDEQLPEEVYVLGFIKSYARYLNLDAPKTVLDYRREGHHQLKTPELVFPESESDHRLMPPIAIICGCLILAGGYLGWYFFGDTQPSPADQPVVDPASMPVEQTLKNLPLRHETLDKASGSDSTNSDATSNKNVDQGKPSNSTSLSTSVDEKDKHNSESQPPQAGDSQFQTLYGTHPDAPKQAPNNTVDNSQNTPVDENKNTSHEEDIILRALDWCKVDVRNHNGQKVVSLVLQPGDEWSPPSEGGPYEFSTDNLGALVLKQGQDISAPLGAKNVPGEDIALAPKTFTAHHHAVGVLRHSSPPKENSEGTKNLQDSQTARSAHQENTADLPTYQNKISPQPVSAEKLPNEGDESDSEHENETEHNDGDDD